MTDSMIVLAPLLLVAVGGLAMMVADAFATSKAELSIVSSVILFAAAATSLALWFGGPENIEPGIVGAYLAHDRTAHFLDLAICGGGGMAALLAGGYLREHGLERGEFYVLVLFAAFGAMVLGRAIDLLTLFLGLETMSLAVYGLVAFRRASPRAAEGAVKYYLLGSFASAILLFGMALLYGATGETGMEAIANAIESGINPANFVPPGGQIAADAGPQAIDATLLLLAAFLLTVGLAFKVSAVPFHAWAPDAYEGAVTPATTFMAVVVKAAVFGAMIRVFFVALGDEGLASPDSGWPPALAALSAITMVVGNLAAIVQKSVKRMLAYSSIAHAGYLLLGMVAAWKTDQGSGLNAVLYYLAAYTVSNVLAFGSLIWIGSRGREAVTFEDLAGVGRRHPFVAVPFVLGVLSLMGFPPMAGFFGKYYVILAAVEAGGGLVWLAVLAVLTSAVSAYYYLRVIVFLFMRTPEPGAPLAVPMRSGHVAAALVIAGYFVLRLGLTPDAYLQLVGASEDAPIDLWTYAVDFVVVCIGAGVAAALGSPRPASVATVEPQPSST